MNIKLNKQTILSNPENGIIGNCFQTCVANLLGIDINDVPHFYNLKNPLIEFYKWLDENGYKSIEFRNINCSHWFQSEYWGYHIISGPSPRGKTYHAVIGLNGDIFFDVHPDGTGLADGDRIYTFIVRK